MLDDETATNKSEDVSLESKTSELLRITVQGFPLGMVIEVDEGDAVSCTMVVEVERNGAADKARLQRGDCLRGFLIDDEFVTLDGQGFKQVMDVLSTQKNESAVIFIVERWCKTAANDRMYRLQPTVSI